jgi:hypothetical protein
MLDLLSLVRALLIEGIRCHICDAALCFFLHSPALTRPRACGFDYESPTAGRGGTSIVQADAQQSAERIVLDDARAAVTMAGGYVSF